MRQRRDATPRKAARPGYYNIIVHEPGKGENDRTICENVSLNTTAEDLFEQIYCGPWRGPHRNDNKRKKINGHVQ